jgi:hypothetical protein
VEAAMVTVKYNDLFLAVDFASSEGFDTSAYVCTVTGKTYFVSSEIKEEDQDAPDDVETSDRYLAVPTKKELDLGKPLVLSFIEDELPDDLDRAEDFFRKRGAYARFKDLLDIRGVREKWYKYEEAATRTALRLWCEENGLELSFEEAGPA